MLRYLNECKNCEIYIYLILSDHMTYSYWSLDGTNERTVT